MGVASAGLGLVGSIAGASAQSRQANYNADLANKQGALSAEMIRNQIPQIQAQSEFVRKEQQSAYGSQFRDLNYNIKKGVSDSISQFGASGFSAGSKSKLAVLRSQLSQGEYALTKLTNDAMLSEQKRLYSLSSDMLNAENQARIAAYGGSSQAGSIMMSSQTQQTSNMFGIAQSLLNFAPKVATSFSF